MWALSGDKQPPSVGAEGSESPAVPGVGPGLPPHRHGRARSGPVCPPAPPAAALWAHKSGLHRRQAASNPLLTAIPSAAIETQNNEFPRSLWLALSVTP